MTSHEITFNEDTDEWFHIACTCGFTERVAGYTQAAQHIDLHLDLVRVREWSA